MTVATDIAGRTSRSRQIRESLSHPVIDADGHWIESTPVFLDFLRDAGGPAAVENFREMRENRSEIWYRMTVEERRLHRKVRPGWWGLPADALDRATAMLPALMHERLDEFGIDVALVYPTLGLLATVIPDADYRRCFIRALNTMASEVFAGLEDRLLPAAIIPTHTPEEAIEELAYATSSLGMRLAFVNGSIRRPIAAGAGAANGTREPAQFVDNLVLDSATDYDPLWQEFVARGVAVTSHAGSMGWSDRRSPSNFTFNHIGHFAQSNHVFAKALFLGGVPHRFPELNFAFLEGGVGWAMNLYFDLVGHFEKRSSKPMLEKLRPTRLDLDSLRVYFERFASGPLAGRVDDVIAAVDTFVPELSLRQLAEREVAVDDFAASGVTGKHDITKTFGRSFFFGCEADDPMTACAYDPRLRAPVMPLFSSDIGHFDVLDMAEVVEEAHEMVEHGFLSASDFEDFIFANSVRLHGRMNANFFVGTRVEEAARAVLEHD